MLLIRGFPIAVQYTADLIAVKLEEIGQYYISKDKYHTFKDKIISKDIFKAIINEYDTPIVLSNNSVRLENVIGM